MLDTSWERLPGSEQGRLLLYEKFSVFRYHTYEQSCIVIIIIIIIKGIYKAQDRPKATSALFLQMFQKIVHRFVGNSFISLFAP